MDPVLIARRQPPLSPTLVKSTDGFVEQLREKRREFSVAGSGMENLSPASSHTRRLNFTLPCGESGGMAVIISRANEFLNKFETYEDRS